MKFKIVVILLIFSVSVTAEQIKLKDYKTVQSSVFWENLYPNGGYSFYCGLKFSNRSEAENGEKLSIEHIVPANEMTKLFNCGTRKQCRKDNVSFNRMEADLHNMYPASSRVNSSRQDVELGIIEGENHRFEWCDYERISGLAEPRKITRGNIARSYFYMIKEYNLVISDEYKERLKKWNRIDLPTCNEIKRNNIIEKIQGTRNRFIDLPELAESL